jgi:hypothetical protein
MPTGSLSIEETRSDITSLVLRFEKNGDVVSQLEVEVKENGKVELLLKGVNFDWSEPLADATASLTINEIQQPVIEDGSPEKKPRKEEEILEDVLATCENLLADEVMEKLDAPSRRDSFQAALDALPRIHTPRPLSTTDTSLAPSECGEYTFNEYIKTSIAGKRYKLKLRKDGGITCDLTGVLTGNPNSKHVKRNVFITKSKNSLGEISMIVLSKARPKASMPIDALPSGIDLAIGNGKASYGSNPTGAALGYTNEEMDMLKTIREAVVLYYAP